MKEIEVLIKPYTSQCRNYVVSWRNKRKINWFNFWNEIPCVYSFVNLSYDTPKMFSNWDEAVLYGRQIKENPQLLKDHQIEQDKKFKRLFYERNKTLIIK